MKRVATAAVLIVLVVLALFKAPLWLFTFLVFGVAVLAAHEYFGIAKAQGYRPFEAMTYACLVVSFVVSYGTASEISAGVIISGNSAVAGVASGSLFLFGLPIIALVSPLVMMILTLRRNSLSQCLPDAAISYMMLPYVGFTLGLLPVLRAFDNGSLFVLFLMLLVWCGDIAAYYVGRAIGTHKLAPRVSPGKSWEGAIASVLAAVVVGLVLFHVATPIADALRSIHLLAAPGFTPPQTAPRAPFWLVVLFAICVNVSAQLGDLVESALKRGAGVKDSGTILPGHGGVLDRTDALLFALPVGVIFYLAAFIRYFAFI